MRIFTLYMAKRFFRPFLFGLGIFALLIFLADMIDKMNYLVKSRAGLGIIFQYLWLGVPYWAIRVIPMATLLATLIALTGFIRSGEWLAVQTSGFEPRDFWRPVLGCSLLVTFLSFAAQETILPACYRRARKLWQDQIHPEWEWDKYFNIALIGGPDEFIEAKAFFPKDGRMERPIWEKIGPRGIERQLDAHAALWDAFEGRWIFYDGVERRWTQGAYVQEPFTRKRSDLALAPRNLIPRTENPDEMSLRELRRYRDNISRLGLSARQLQVAVHHKIAYPFTNLVICALGIPIALRLRRAAKAVNFFVALSVSFLYLWFSELAQVLGMGGKLSPMAAAWVANTIFGGAAVFLMCRRG